ncbi:WecB/TagA/CpsF family glycosyltransferase [Shimia sp. R11_0]|uniref:WecB/TagA/CpsF family glycosyltransferase n=1 Tax=Shimia sp. R11_0 TaxID=2821096 RepID=UPI001ADB5F36|nr:WecB/TagA/CpsF family glycosyltransferase [Shimia sp. R11_0]
MQFSTIEGPVTVNVPDHGALKQAVGQRLAAKEGFALATLNLDHLVKLSSDGAFAQAYLAQDFVVADGNPIVWLSRLARRPVALLPGADLVVPLAEWCAAAGVPVALIGSTEEALAAASTALRGYVTGLEVAACVAPPMGFDPQSAAAETLLQEVAASGAGLAFLALGAPKQEALAARGRQLVPNVGFASIGAGLDFLAGTQKRAPRWVRRLALEWLWRALSNPARLALRYLRCIGILPRLLREALRQRSGI